MRIPLRYQITEFDCGPTSLINAFSYLYDREEIPPDLIRAISLYTLDEYDHNRNAGGTSKEAMSFLTKWFMSYAMDNQFNLVSKRYEKSDVTLELIKKCIEDGSVLIVRLIQDVEHYVILTHIDDEFVYLFDPYFLEEDYYDKDNDVEIIFNKPFNFNRKVRIKRFDSEGTEDFALGKKENREIVSIKRTKIVGSSK